jgi:ketosteroid isomerase-like protein
MSKENVELMRAVYAEGFELGQVDPELVERAFRDFFEERFELHVPSRYPEGGEVFEGRDGFVRWLEGMRNVWSEWRTEPEQFLDAGDRVVVFVHLHAKGATGGTPLDVKTAHVWTISEGRALSFEAFLDRSEALEAVGLRE